MRRLLILTILLVIGEGLLLCLLLTAACERTPDENYYANARELLASRERFDPITSRTLAIACANARRDAGRQVLARRLAEDCARATDKLGKP